MGGMTFKDFIDVAIKDLRASGLVLPMTLVVIPNSKTAAVLRVFEDGNIKAICPSPPLATAPDAKIHFLALDRDGRAGAKTFELTPEVHDALTTTLHLLMARDLPVV